MDLFWIRKAINTCTIQYSIIMREIFITSFSINGITILSWLLTRNQSDLSSFDTSILDQQTMVDVLYWKRKKNRLIHHYSQVQEIYSMDRNTVSLILEMADRIEKQNIHNIEHGRSMVVTGMGIQWCMSSNMKFSVYKRYKNSFWRYKIYKHHYQRQSADMIHK